MGWIGYGGGSTSLAQKSGGGAPITATGGDKSTSGDYTYHVFGSEIGSDAGVSANETLNATFSVSAGGPWEIDILLAGGGGGGGGFAGGGGGAGALIIQTLEIDGAPVGDYPMRIGMPGDGGPSPGKGEDGQPSLFGPGTPTPLEAPGGGGGGNGAFSGGYPGNPGGSGGGAGRGDNEAGNFGEGTENEFSPTGSPPGGYGHDGGNGEAAGGGGGGGGAGTGGAQANPGEGGGGGNGVGTVPWIPTTLPGGTYSWPSPTNPGMPYRNGLQMWCGGGGGGGSDNPNGPARDGAGSGTTGNAQPYCGSGGGGAKGPGTPRAGGYGSRGVCVIRYLT